MDSPASELKAIVTNAIRFWEPLRIVYNVVLAGIVGAYFLSADFVRTGGSVTGQIVGFAVLAVMANVLYCSAYAVDIFLQFSGFREVWLKWRWGLFLLGLGFSSALALVITGFIGR